MTTKVLPFATLSQRIAEQESQLESLRREHGIRQAQLAELTRRKDDLAAQLQQVDREILAIRQGQTPRSIPSAPEPVPATPRGTLPATDAKTVPLPHFLVNLVRESGRAMTVKELADEVIQRKFPTSSQNVPNLVQTRVRELVRKGILKRNPKGQGVVLGKDRAGQATTPRKATSRPTKAKSTRRTKAPARRGEGQPSLREVLTNILKKNRRPMSGQELADAVLATGYQTSSKNFLTVIWVMAGRIDGVENVPGKGYRWKGK